MTSTPTVWLPLRLGKHVNQVHISVPAGADLGFLADHIYFNPVTGFYYAARSDFSAVQDSLLAQFGTVNVIHDFPQVPVCSYECKSSSESIRKCVCSCGGLLHGGIKRSSTDFGLIKVHDDWDKNKWTRRSWTRTKGDNRYPLSFEHLVTRFVSMRAFEAEQAADEEEQRTEGNSPKRSQMSSPKNDQIRAFIKQRILQGDRVTTTQVRRWFGGGAHAKALIQTAIRQLRAEGEIGDYDDSYLDTDGRNTLGIGRAYPTHKNTDDADA